MTSREAGTDPQQEWWRHAAIYQIYPRSFADGNGDGTGDIAGMRSRLAYLQQLGIDAIWVNPWYRSPLLDGGYDVADYRQIADQDGTIAEAEAFIDEARERGIRVIVDLVPNHVSFHHEWFVAALAAAPGSPERSRFHFLPGRGDDGELPPNNWSAVFGGPAWTRTKTDGVPGDWYLHLFNHSQPDVNWEHPEVVEELESVMRFWLDRGAAGFRVDVAHGLMKAPGYPDVDMSQARYTMAWYEGHPYWDRDELHPVVRRWRALLDEYDDRMMVAEAWVSPGRLARYLRPDEYHQAFEFDLLSADWSAATFTAIIGDSVAAAASVGSNPTWVLSNHDVVRHATRYGLPSGTNPSLWLLDGPAEVLDAERGARRGRAAGMLTLALPGAVYIYQGDELGLPEAWDLPVDVLDDPVWEDSGRTVKGRDGCRVPIPWELDGPSFGFGASQGWLPQPPEFADLSAAAQDGDANSTLSLYRRALALRDELFIQDRDIEFLVLGDDVVGFSRGSGVRCVVNMGDVAVPMPEGELLLASDATVDATTTELASDVAVWLR
jgi:alpha-glucosidase